MRPNVWLLILIILAGCDTSTSTSGGGGGGTPRFEVARLADGYRLLSAADKALVDRRIWRVVESPDGRSGVVHDCNRGVINVGYRGGSIYWNASVLVHEAIHVQECHQACINDQERIAIREQIRVLRYVGAPRHEIEYAIGALGWHCN